MNLMATRGKVNDIFDLYDFNPSVELKEQTFAWLLDHLTIQDITDILPVPYHILVNLTPIEQSSLGEIHGNFCNQFRQEWGIIQDIRMAWLEYRCAEPTVDIKADIIEVQYILQPHLDIDTLIHNEINRGIEQGLHIPFRYLKVIGRC